MILQTAKRISNIHPLQASKKLPQYRNPFIQDSICGSFFCRLIFHLLFQQSVFSQLPFQPDFSFINRCSKPP